MNKNVTSITSLDNDRQFQSFMLKEMIISSGVINGILNGLIYYFTTKEEVALFAFGINVMLTMVILTVIILPIYPALAKMKLKNTPDLRIPYTQEKHMIAAKLPTNKFARGFIIVLICTLVCTPFSVGIAGCFGMTALTRIQGAIIKGIACGLCSVIAYYFAVIFVFFSREK